MNVVENITKSAEGNLWQQLKKVWKWSTALQQSGDAWVHVHTPTFTVNVHLYVCLFYYRHHYSTKHLHLKPISKLFSWQV